MPTVALLARQYARGAARTDMPVVLDHRTPTWEALRLDPHLVVIKVALVAYAVPLVALWLQFGGVWHPGKNLFDAMAWTVALAYLAMNAEAFYVRKVMYDSVVYKHGPGNVIAAAVFLNPCVLGWWMPVSVVFAARRVRRELEEFAASRPTDSMKDAPVEPSDIRRADWLFRSSIRPFFLVLGLLLLLFLAWSVASFPARKHPDGKASPSAGESR
jgi:hypothetical protein